MVGRERRSFEGVRGKVIGEGGKELVSVIEGVKVKKDFWKECVVYYVNVLGIEEVEKG